MPEFEKLKLKNFPLIKNRETGEAKYWKSYRISSQEKLLSSPNCIHFNYLHDSSEGNNNFLVTASTKVSLYDASTDKIIRSYTRFSDDAFSGKFRKDNRLIIAGDKSGLVKVFDVQTKSMLRQMKKHTAGVRSVEWLASGVHMISGSDDKKVFKWDLSTEEMVWSSKSYHSDYVRSVIAHPKETDIFVSGGYDHNAYMWDSRTDKPVISFNPTSLNGPIEHSLMSPSGTMLFVACKNEIKVFDILGSGRLMHTFSNHQKNITGLSMDGTSNRLLSCGLDGHVKFYSLQTMSNVHGTKYGQPLSSVAVSPDNRKLVVGYVDGNLTIRTRSKETNSRSSISNDSDEMIVDNDLVQRQKYYKGAGYAVLGTDLAIIETERVEGLRPYEKQLKNFNYQQALDHALKTRNPLIVVTVLEELSRRNGLTIALSGRDEVTLEPLLSFAARYISNPRYCKLIVQVTENILDLYACVLGHSDAIDELFLKLQRQVKTEVIFQRDVMSVLGSLDGIIQTALQNK